jgi:hypothetical protein
MRAAAVVILLAVLVPRSARAFEDFDGTRALSMGGATRAWALGDSALLLNPSGMSLAKAYDVEASYGYGSRLSEQFLHASVVDSTSAAGLAGGIYYTYHFDKPGGLPGHGHEVGAALSLPLGPAVAVGATLKWFHLEGSDDDAVPAVTVPPTTATASGLTFDVGATVRPTANFSLALVGMNLVDHDQGQMPRMVTYGAAVLPIPELVLAVDGVTTFTRDPLTGARGTGLSGTGVRGGLEASIVQRVTLRAGGGTDPVLGVGYLAAGVSALGEAGAVDFGLRGDLFPYRTGSGRAVFLSIALRLFVPGAVASAAAQSP